MYLEHNHNHGDDVHQESLQPTASFTAKEFGEAAPEQQFELFQSLPDAMQGLFILLSTFDNPIPGSWIDTPDTHQELGVDQAGFAKVWKDAKDAGYLIESVPPDAFILAEAFKDFIGGPYQALWAEQRGEE